MRRVTHRGRGGTVGNISGELYMPAASESLQFNYSCIHWNSASGDITQFRLVQVRRTHCFLLQDRRARQQAAWSVLYSAGRLLGNIEILAFLCKRAHQFEKQFLLFVVVA
jgi:hypothetical protein